VPVVGGDTTKSEPAVEAVVAELGQEGAAGTEVEHCDFASCITNCTKNTTITICTSLFIKVASFAVIPTPKGNSFCFFCKKAKAGKLLVSQEIRCIAACFLVFLI
jgi:hypothetical protein